MARKYDLISELYDRTCASVSENPLNWQGLLRTASYNFRLRFDEQLLLYAQRPDATAVLPIERWNGSFGRWVNRGAKVSPYSRTRTVRDRDLLIILTYRIPTEAVTQDRFPSGR